MRTQSSVVICLLSASMVGCFSVANLPEMHSRDISNKEKSWAGFKRNGIYATTMDLFIVDSQDPNMGLELTVGTNKDISLGGRGFHKTAPTTIEQYKREPQRWPVIIGVVDAGTRIRAVQLVEESSIWISISGFKFVKGDILDGPHEGIRVCLFELTDYRSRKGKTNELEGPDSFFLRPVVDEI